MQMEDAPFEDGMKRRRGSQQLHAHLMTVAILSRDYSMFCELEPRACNRLGHIIHISARFESRRDGDVKDHKAGGRPLLRT